MLFWGLHYADSEPDCLVATRRHEHVTHEPQWNLDLTKFQGTGEMCSLYRGFIISKTSILRIFGKKGNMFVIYRGIVDD